MKPTTLFLLLLLARLAQAQSPTQTVQGLILDKISLRPIAGATVAIDGGQLSTTTNDAGRFAITNVPTGRIMLSITAVGYQPASIRELLLTAGKQLDLEIALEQSFRSLDEVVVKGSRTRKGSVANEYAGSSARSFTIEQITRYAGGRNDPSKLVSNFAGVVSNNDSRNDIVVRGNSPTGVLWRIEGLPASNPNHFSTLGTTGGPVSSLNTNALKTSDFYTGAFPAEYGNATAAVFDINFRNGNAQTHERTVQVNLFSGLEAMLEGPLSKKKSGGSYLLGYRYSFAQIGQSLGLNIGTDAVPKYQDWVYNIDFGKRASGKFSLYGMGGRSNIAFIGKDIDTSDFYSRKDQDTYLESNLYMFGAKHVIDIGKRSYLKTVASYSITQTDFENFQYPTPVPPYQDRWLVTQSKDRQQVLRVSSLFNSKISNRISWRVGGTAELFHLKTKLNGREGKPQTESFETLRDYANSFMLLQYFGQVRYKATEQLALVAGLRGMSLLLNNTHLLEPRLSVTYQLNPKNTLGFSYGLHGQAQPFPVYFYEDARGGILDRSNRELGFTKAHHYVLSLENRLSADWRIKLEAYHQAIFDAPVERMRTGFSILNAGADFSFPEKAGLMNNGTGSNTGVELTVERFLSKGYYLLVSGSLFNSKYKGSDGVSRNSSFNYGYASNVLAGAEWKWGKRSAVTLDLRFAVMGGRYTTPVDVVSSRVQKKEVLDEARYNSERLPGYMRGDVKLGYRVNSRKRKMSQTLYFDFQNVSNRKNIFLRRYNPLYETVGTVNQIGFFPDLLYRIQF